ncbi:hypothetical protein PR048_024806 [Dryococelus australis]|uniref:Uncharacterized protein n=1 Tax=Dryococelus australis TaxID=614101 RepID=A0ABQ9GPP4_9NEOP|nr:hypothetical protein PR048_024806 [Dryococelus australis]
MSPFLSSTPGVVVQRRLRPVFVAVNCGSSHTEATGEPVSKDKEVVQISRVRSQITSLEGYLFQRGFLSPSQAIAAFHTVTMYCLVMGGINRKQDGDHRLLPMKEWINSAEPFAIETKSTNLLMLRKMLRLADAVVLQITVNTSMPWTRRRTNGSEPSNGHHSACRGRKRCRKGAYTRTNRTVAATALEHVGVFFRRTQEDYQFKLGSVLGRVVRVYVARESLPNQSMAQWEEDDIVQLIQRMLGAKSGVQWVDPLRNEVIKLFVCFLHTAGRRVKKGRQKEREKLNWASDVYKSKWFAFEDLRFLEDRDAPRKRLNTGSKRASRRGRQHNEADSSQFQLSWIFPSKQGEFWEAENEITVEDIDEYEEELQDTDKPETFATSQQPNRRRGNDPDQSSSMLSSTFKMLKTAAAKLDTAQPENDEKCENRISRMIMTNRASFILNETELAPAAGARVGRPPCCDVTLPLSRIQVNLTHDIDLDPRRGVWKVPECARLNLLPVVATRQRSAAPGAPRISLQLEAGLRYYTYLVNDQHPNSSFAKATGNQSLTTAKAREDMEHFLLRRLTIYSSSSHWLGRSPPITAIPVRSQEGSLPDFRMWEFLGVLPFPPPALAFQHRSILGPDFMSCPGMTGTYGSQLESLSLGECCLALGSIPIRVITITVLVSESQ